MTKAEYARLEDVAWSEYDRVTRAALTEREWAIAQAKVEYKRVERTARAECEKAIADARRLL
jgi:hypothetical protein